MRKSITEANFSQPDTLPGPAAAPEEGTESTKAFSKPHQNTINGYGHDLKQFWRRQHASHVAIAIVGAVDATFTLFVAARGFYVYLGETRQRVDQSHLIRLQTMDAAWQTLGSRLIHSQ
jgi:hypothetical protein